MLAALASTAVTPDGRLNEGATRRASKRSASPRSAVRYERRRAEVVEAGAKLFARRGYEATSIGDIAEAVGLLKGSLYYYAPSKEELLHTIIREVHDQGREVVANVRRKGGEPVEQLRELIRTGAVFVLRNPEKNLVSMRDYRSLSDELREDLRPDRTLYYEALCRLITRCQKARAIRRDLPVEHIGTAILGAINYLPTWLERMEFDPESMATSYTELFLEGLKPASS